MKLNWAERWVVNNPVRILQQQIEIVWFKKKMLLKEDALVLEVGCGRGAGARLILREFQPLEICCLDIDIQMIKQARAYLSSKERERISLNTGDSAHLPYKDGVMDAVFGFGVLHHVPDWRGALMEISRVIKPRGVYFMEELYPALYQNIVTKQILLHPRKNRFLSHDLRNAVQESKLTLEYAVENKRVGILGIAVKDN